MAAGRAKLSEKGPSEQILELLRLDQANALRLVSRENRKLEYKERFNWGNRAKYAKTMAAFANCVGGFIVFGVKDSPRDLIGVNSQRFDNLDPAQVTEYLNSTFSPELHWEVFDINLAEIRLGVIFVAAAAEKPVVCIKTDANVLRDADIYYRYRGRSERIRYPELQRILLERQQRERDAWFDLLSRVARIGVENVGVLDFVDGSLSGGSGRVLVSKDLLDQVQFIREGDFSENDDSGTPVLRLVGEVEAVAPGALRPVRTVKEPFVIGAIDIMLGFLRQRQLAAPAQYVKQACRENSSYMPIYHFAQMAGIDLEDLRTFIRRESVRSKLLLSRIDGRLVSRDGSLHTGTPSAIQRAAILEDLHAGNIKGLLRADRFRLFQAVTHFTPTEPPAPVMNLLGDLVENDFGTMTSSERTVCRKAVAHLDEVLNRPNLATTEVHQEDA